MDEGSSSRSGPPSRRPADDIARPSVAHAQPAVALSPTWSSTGWRFPDPAVERDYSLYCTDRYFIYIDHASWFMMLTLVSVVYVKAVNSSVYLLSAIPFLLQGVLMMACPQFYRQQRTHILVAMRCFRICMAFRVTSLSHTISITGVKDCYKVLLVFSGAVPYALLALAYNVPLHLHVPLQLAACAMVYFQLSPICCRAFEQLSFPHAATEIAGSSAAAATPTSCMSIAWFGLRSAQLSRLQCQQLFLAITAFLGFLVPTYIVYAMDAALRVRFAMRRRHAADGRREEQRWSSSSSSSSVVKHASILALAALLCHRLLDSIVGGGEGRDAAPQNL